MRKFRCKRFFWHCRAAASSAASMDCPTFIRSNEQKPFYCRFNSIARRFFFSCPEKLFVRQFQLVNAGKGNKKKVIKSR
jgi:hypothetical protein